MSSVELDTHSTRGERPGDLDVLRQRRRLERDPHAGRDAAAHHLRRRRRGRAHRAQAGRRIGARAFRRRIVAAQARRAAPCRAAGGDRSK